MKIDFLEKPPINNFGDSIAAEQGIIGCILMDNSCIESIYGELLPEHFYGTLNQKIYKACLNLYNNGESINLSSLSLQLEDKDHKQYTMQDIVRTFVNTSSISDIHSYVNVIKINWKKRRLGDIMSRAPDILARDVDSGISKMLLELTELQKEQEHGSKTIREILQENRHKYFNRNYNPKYLYIGIDHADALMGGIENGDVVCVAARPGVGKSAFVTQIVCNVASQGKKTIYYNLEMENKQILDRVIAHLSGISMTRLKHAKEFESAEEERSFNETADLIKKNELLIINDKGSKTVLDIRNECKYMDNLGLIVIDYIQLMKSDKAYGNRTQEVGEISKAIKRLAKELHIPIIILSQLNRAVEGRAVKEPVLSDLREAGDIEQDCSIVAFLWNIDENKRDEKGFKVEKNRQGKHGKSKLFFNGALMNFSDISEEPLEFDDSINIDENEITPFDD